MELNKMDHAVINKIYNDKVENDSDEIKEPRPIGIKYRPHNISRI